MPWELYWASSRARWTGGVIKDLFSPPASSRATGRLLPPASPLSLPYPLSLPLPLSISLPFSLPLPLSSLVAAHRLRLMAGSTAKSSQCDKVIWSHRVSETERGKECRISATIYTDHTAMRKWSKNKNKWGTLDDITAPRLLTAVFAVISRWLWSTDDSGSRDLLLSSRPTFPMSCMIE